ncbi:MAG TPA: thiol:disulfide interchange protein, partial [Prevotella sp.]|nr:thiol:disulfide interchange protein [Prevotella sp.]
MKESTTKKVLLTTLMMLLSIVMWAQGNPVHFTVSQKQVSDTEVDVIFKGKIAVGWHVYAPNIPADGPIPATITTEKAEGVKAVGKLQAKGKEIKEYDQIFGMQ